MGVESCNGVSEVRTKRVALNSLFLFIRFGIIMVLNLYSMRYVLNGLGQVDYGIYSAVANVVLTSACLIPVLSMSIQRYYSFYLGTGDANSYSGIFSASINIVLVLILLLFIVFEIVGFLFLDKMTIPAERLDSAMWVFQCALFSFFFTIFQIPFLASIFAHEEMKLYTLVSATECVLKFVAACGIAYSSWDGLVFYSTALLVVSVLIFLSYAAIATSKYKECRYCLNAPGKSMYRELLSFSGWTFYGAISGVGMIQGSTILLNLFFGPIINAAFGIALTIYNAFTSISNSVIVAFRPAMIKSFAEGNLNYLDKLFNIGNRAVLYLLLMIMVPAIMEMPYILSLWLGTQSDDTVLFCRLIVAFSVILAMHNPITTIIQSSGNIRKYTLVVETITILNLPISWLLFRMGAPSYSLLITMVTLCLIAHVMRLYCLKVQYSRFSLRTYITKLALPGCAVLLLCFITSFLIEQTIEVGVVRLLILCVVNPLLILLSVFSFGVSKSERRQLIRFLNAKLGGCWRCG